ncbi:unnamed protein product [Allacma fusca]|uniref:Heat shock protein 70 n=1 Tax=Allacma fusca TaxID=39272 RepID=A0A8J2L899_9HEXA|nr:unnamed protein product [Allacma fusca]
MNRQEESFDPDQEYTIVIGRGCSKLFKNNAKYEDRCTKVKHQELFLSKERILKLKPNNILKIQNAVFDILLLYGKELGSTNISERIIKNSDLIKVVHNEVQICIGLENEKNFTPFEVISKISSELRKKAAIPKHAAIKATVVYPFNYDEKVLQELKKAFDKKLNINVEGFINRDIAIAYNYFQQNRLEKKFRTILSVHCNSRALVFSLFQMRQDNDQLEIIRKGHCVIHSFYDGFRNTLLRHCLDKFHQEYKEDLNINDPEKSPLLRSWRVKKLESLQKICSDVTSNFLIHRKKVCKIDLLDSEIDHDFITSTLICRIKNPVKDFEITQEQFEEYNAHNFQIISKEFYRMTSNVKVDDVVLVGCRQFLLKDFPSAQISSLTEHWRKIEDGTKRCSSFFASLEIMKSRSQHCLKIISEPGTPRYVSMVDEASSVSQVDEKEMDTSEEIFAEEMNSGNDVEQLLENEGAALQEDISDNNEISSGSHTDKDTEIKEDRDKFDEKKVTSVMNYEHPFENIDDGRPATCAPILSNANECSGLLTPGHRQESVIGIDFGTTSCCMAIARDTYEELIPNNLNKNITLSCVTYDMEKASCQLLGEEAKIRGHENPEGTFHSIKKFLGGELEEKYLQQFQTFTSFKFGYQSQKSSQQETYTPTPDTILLELLKYLKGCAATYLGMESTDPIKAVVALPSFFTSYDRNRVEENCTKAGFNVMKFIQEPIAVALAFINSRKNTALRNYLVFDLGGGKLDTAVVTAQNKEITQYSTLGTPALGGDDIDHKMVQYCIDQFNQDNTLDNTSLDNENDAQSVARRILRLKKHCEEQKRFLTSTKNGTVNLEGYYRNQDLRVPLRRDKFEDLIDDTLKQCLDIVNAVVRESRVDKGNIQEIIIVGNCSRIPAIIEKLKAAFPRATVIKQFDNELVAKGAARSTNYLESLEPASLFNFKE